ncbi:MAG: COG4280 domain-containing protein [Aggregatilineales bacterium]
MSSTLLLVLSTFLASAVESVEALTIVLATGITRGWRSTFLAVGAALLALAALVIIGGPAITTLVPISALRIVIGVLLLVFGLQWLRKAILRASGLKSLRDEEANFKREVNTLSAEKPRPANQIDWTGFVVAFKGVFLEGLEVVFIVITFGSSANNVPLAALGAVLAVLLVTVIGAAVNQPLSRVPENALKFSVGLMLVAFGTFWSGEGLGVTWPGADWFLIGLVVLYALLSWGLVLFLRGQHVAVIPSAPQSAVEAD